MNMTLWIAPLVLSAVVEFRVRAQTIHDPARAAEDGGAGAVGSIQGTVSFQGEIPKARIADDAGVRRALLEVDRETRGLRYVVAYLAPAPRASHRQPGSPTVSSKATVIVDQQDYAFVPRVVAVREGDRVVFSNSDLANHNVRTTSAIPQNVFNVFTGAGGQYEHRFAADTQRRPIQLGCDFHPWMRAWVYVFDHPHFALSDPRGQFRIHSVPTGEYKLVLQQPDVRYTNEQSITVSSGQATKVHVEIRADQLPQRKE